MDRYEVVGYYPLLSEDDPGGISSGRYFRDGDISRAGLKQEDQWTFDTDCHGRLHESNITVTLEPFPISRGRTYTHASFLYSRYPAQTTTDSKNKSAVEASRGVLMVDNNADYPTQCVK